MKSKQTNSKKQSFAPYTNPFSNLGEKDDSLMDWSSETPAPSSSMPTSHISPAGEHVPSPHVPPSLKVVLTAITYPNDQILY